MCYMFSNAISEISTDITLLFLDKYSVKYPKPILKSNIICT